MQAHGPGAEMMMIALLGPFASSDPCREHWGLTYHPPTSGDLNTLPSDHMSAPYTLISCCWSTWSALFRMMRI
jgi:hypothetical protein